MDAPSLQPDTIERIAALLVEHAEETLNTQPLDRP
jgi:hypothetical protein